MHEKRLAVQHERVRRFRRELSVLFLPVRTLVSVRALRGGKGGVQGFDGLAERVAGLVVLLESESAEALVDEALRAGRSGLAGEEGISWWTRSRRMVRLDLRGHSWERGWRKGMNALPLDLNNVVISY